MTEDMNKGIIDRFRSLPMARSAVLSGRTIVRRDLQRRHPRRADAHGASHRLARHTTASPTSWRPVALLLAFTYAMAWVGVFLGLSVPTVEVAQQVGFIVIFPLTFLSNAFVPHRDAARAGCSRSPSGTRSAL